MEKLKKAFVYIGILFLIALSVYFLVDGIQQLVASCHWLSEYKETLNQKLSNPDIVANSVEELEYWVAQLKTPIIKQSIQVAIGALSIVSCVFLFIYCNPRLFRLSTWTNLSDEWAQNKEERGSRRQVKEIATKQKNIEEKQKQIADLQAELDKLNAEDKTNLNS